MVPTGETVFLDATDIADEPVAKLLDKLIMTRGVATESTKVDVVVGGVRRVAIALKAGLEIDDLRAEILKAGLSTLDIDGGIDEDDGGLNLDRN